MHDYVIMDRENHASLYDGCKLSYGKMLRFRHADMEDLEKKLQKVPAECGCLIVTDGVFSMGGDIANLPEIFFITGNPVGPITLQKKICKIIGMENYTLAL